MLLSFFVWIGTTSVCFNSEEKLTFGNARIQIFCYKLSNQIFVQFNCLSENTFLPWYIILIYFWTNDILIVNTGRLHVTQHMTIGSEKLFIFWTIIGKKKQKQKHFWYAMLRSVNSKWEHRFLQKSIFFDILGRKNILQSLGGEYSIHRRRLEDRTCN